MKTNDLLPIYQAQLTHADGSAVDLSSVTSVLFYMADAVTGAIKINGVACAVVAPATNGTIQYVWASGDTATAGTYNAEVQVTFTSGKMQTWPNNGYQHVLLVQDL